MVRKFFANRNLRPTPQPNEPLPQRSDLGSLPQHLQEILQQQVAQPNRLQIRCAVRDGVLLILVEHLLHVEPDPQKTFAVLEQLTTEVIPSLMESDPGCSPTAYARPLPARIYLRVAGYQQPYAFHSFTLEPRSAVTSNGIASFEVNSVELYSPPLEETAEPEAEPEMAEPEVVAPLQQQVVAPEITEPEPAPQQVVDPETAEPEIPEFEVSEPLQQQVAEPEIVEPEVSEPEVEEGFYIDQSEVERSQQQVVELETAEPEMAEPEVVEPLQQQVVELEVSELEIAEPEPSERQAAEPETIPEPDRFSSYTQELNELSDDSEAAIEETAEEIILEINFEAVETETSRTSENLAETSENLTETIEPTIEFTAHPEESLLPEFDQTYEELESRQLESAPLELEQPELEQPELEQLELEQLEPDQTIEFSSVNEILNSSITNSLAIDFTPAIDFEPENAEASFQVDETERDSNRIEELSTYDDQNDQAAERIDSPVEDIVDEDIVDEDIIDEDIASEDILGEEVSVENNDDFEQESIASEVVFDSSNEEQSSEFTPECEVRLNEDFHLEQPEQVEHIQENSQIVEESVASSFISSFVDVNPDTHPDTHSDTYLDTYPDTYSDTYSDNFLEESQNPLTNAESNIVYSISDDRSEQIVETQSEPELPELEIFSVEQPEPEPAEPEPFEQLQLESEPELAEPEPAEPEPFEQLQLEPKSEQPEPESAEPESADRLSNVTAFSSEVSTEEQHQSVDTSTSNAPNPEIPYSEIPYSETPYSETPYSETSNLPVSASTATTSVPIWTKDSHIHVANPSASSANATQNASTAATSALLIPNANDAPSSFDRLPTEVNDASKTFFGSKVTLFGVLLTGAVSLFAIVSVGYALTRPCVLSRECQPIQEAQRLSERALTIIQSSPSALEVVDAYDQLTQASQLLEPIPLWSRYRTDARTLLSTYNGELDELGLLVKALNQANIAAKKSVNPPHPVQIWREVQWNWREAIELLEEVPETSPVYSLAQEKQDEYAANLEGINQRIRIEQETQDRISAVRQAAEVIEARSKVLNSTDSWQRTQESWQTLIAQLQQIPQGTIAFGEAQRLLRLYELKIEESEQQRDREVQSSDAYNKAVSFAEQARIAEQRERWAEAAGYWREAVTHVRQVQEGTSNYSQAQALIDSYTDSFNQAEDATKRTSLMQTAIPQLDRACGVNPRLCSYTFGTTAIRVQVATNYDFALQRAFSTAQQSGGMVQADLSPQLNQLLRSLAVAGETAQVPIELYNAVGSKFGMYDPRRGGYVMQ